MKYIIDEKDMTTLANKVADKVSATTISPRWMNVKQAARYSNIGEQRLKAMAKAKVIKGAKDETGNKAWFFDKESIDSYHESFFKAGVSDATIKKLLANADKFL